jgi:uncharacterized protein (TIGR02145 family)
MKNFKKIAVLFLSLVFLFWGLIAQAVGSDNTRVGSDNVIKSIVPELDLSAIYKGGLQTKAEIINFLEEKATLIQNKINNSELIGLRRMPTSLRNGVLSLNLEARENINSMLGKIAGENDILKIKSILQKEQASSNANKKIILYNQTSLLLKNYNRVYETLQNSYIVVNDAINYIDIHNPSSPKYLGVSTLGEGVDVGEIMPLRQELEKIKIEKLDVFKDSLDVKMTDLTRHDFANLSDIMIDGARRDVLNMLVLDLPVYKTNYNTNIKSDIVTNVNSLLVAAGSTEKDLVAASCNSMTDADGNVYKAVLIGEQCWTTKNINVGTMLVSGFVNPNTGNTVIEKWCYNNDPNNCEIYGGLYHWDEAMRGSKVEGAQGICATGWHIPTDAEYNILEKTVVRLIASANPQYVCDLYSNHRRCSDNTGTLEGANGVAQALRMVGLGSGVGVGTDIAGFNGDLPGNRNPNGSFHALGDYLLLWSSTPDDDLSSWYRSMRSSYSTSYRAMFDKDRGFSVRCLKD